MRKSNLLKLLSVVLFCGVLLIKPKQAVAQNPTLFAPGVISSEFTDTTATFTPDGQTVFFVRSDAQENYNTILESHLKDGFWSRPEVASFSGWWNDSEPCVTPDGEKIFFTSNRPVKGNQPLTATFRNRTITGKNIWYVEKHGNDWSEPAHLDGPLAEYKMIYNPSVTKNGTLYFSGVLPEDPAKNQIYRSIPDRNGIYGPPERVSFSDLKWNHMDPNVDPDEKFMIFAANRADSLGGSADIYLVFRKNGVWKEPVNLGASVNSYSTENAPVLAPDGKTLYFSSSRPQSNIYPKAQRDDFAGLTKRLRGLQNGSRDIWKVDISSWINAGLEN